MAKLLFVLLSLSMTLAFFKLSLWQWQRALEKDTQQQLFLSQSLQGAKDLNALSQLSDYQFVEFEGQWHSQQFLWDNRILDGQVGFEHIALHQVQGQLLIVNLGWLATDSQRKLSQSLPQAPKQVRGYLRQAQQPVLLGQWITHADPAIIQYPDPQQLSDLLATPVLPWILETNPNWTPHQKIDAARHRGYAIQWMLMAVTTLTLTLIWIRKK